MNVLATGELVGQRYTVEAEIGRGGMQEVYRARDEVLERIVAVKVPQDARVARKFRDSSVLSAKVNHPNVAKTLDYFEDNAGRFYMVEEYVNGLDLRKITSRFERVDAHTAAHVLHHLARGISASHRVGIVHRDLKPSNVMVVRGLEFEGLKITDFGIAKMAEHEVDQAVSGGAETTRRSTTVMGALAYLGAGSYQFTTQSFEGGGRLGDRCHDVGTFGRQATVRKWFGCNQGDLVRQTTSPSSNNWHSQAVRASFSSTSGCCPFLFEIRSKRTTQCG